jgi:hypothetical protein
MALELGFRRRCSWCGVQLRGWQVNLCQLCGPRTGDAGIYLQSGGPPCGQAARWNEPPDQSKTVTRLRNWKEEWPVEYGVMLWLAMMVGIAVVLTAAGFVGG